MWSEVAMLLRDSFLTEVQTTQALITDGQIATSIHAAKQAKDLLPVGHLVETAYLDAEWWVIGQEIGGVKLVGPTRVDTGW